MLYLAKGDVCLSDSSYNYITALKIKCDPEIIFAIQENKNKFNPNNCFNIIEISSKFVCSQNLINFQMWYKKLFIPKQFICFIFLSIGIYYTLFCDLHRKNAYLIAIGISIIYILTFIVMNTSLSLMLGKLEIFIHYKFSSIYFFKF